MIIDSPFWVRHDDGGGISGLDISPNGRRLATCGTAPQIAIWNMLPILDEKAEKDASVPKVLGVIQDSQGSVLTVRFSHCGTMLAAGCDAAADSAVLIFKQSSAPAVQKQLGCKITSIENWRPVAPLRGHQLDVTALSWSSGDEYLASASMDQKVYIWGISKDGKGHLVHVLDNQHNGWVKGVAFDPIGRYLATQGRNGVKVWDVHSGWTLVTHQRKPFERSPDAGFRYKMSWSPDGEVLIAMNGAESKHLCVCCFSRSSWELTEMVGHRGAVLVSAANPRLFYLPEQLVQQRLNAGEEGQEEGEGEQRAAGDGAVAKAAKAAAAAEAEGGAKYADVASFVFAAGSNDKTITLWCSDLPRPMLQISQIHGGGIVDMAWTPDSYTLIAASLDDRVSVMRFACSELGRAVTDRELQEYVDKAAAEGQQVADIAQHDTLMDAELTALAGEQNEAAADVDAAFPTPPRPAARPAAAAAAAARLAAQPAATAAAARSGGPAAASGGSALDRRLMPQGGGATVGTLAQPRQQQVGQKRLHPTAVGANAPAAAAAGGSGGLPPAKRANTGVQQAPQQQQQQLRQQTGGRAAAGGRGGGWVLPPPGIKANLEMQVALVTVKRTGQQQQQQQDQYQSVTLVVENRRSSSSSSSSTGRTAVAELSLHLGGKKEGHEFWRDKLQEHVVAAAGNLYFSAAVTTSGLLYTWRPKGTPLMPPLALGCPPVSISVEGAWELLIVGADGSMTTLNMAEKCRERSGPVPAPNLAPILAAAAPGTSLQDAWITSSSSSSRPLLIGRTQLAVLTDGSGWLFHPGLGLWVMLKAAAAGAAAAGGSGAAVAVTAGSADAERLWQKAGAHDIMQGLQQVVAQQPPDAAAQRQEAYWQLTAAELLEDANGYQRALGLLVTLLARDKDLERLKELSEDLLGPARWDPSMLAGGSGPPCGWLNTVIGLDKRTLLSHVVIPAMARERLSLAKEVHQHLQEANAFTQQAAATMAAQAAAAAAAAAGAGFGTPAAAGYSSQHELGMGFPDLLRVGPRSAAPAAAAATAAAAGGSARRDGVGLGAGIAAAANGPLAAQQVQRRESGGQSGETVAHATQQQHHHQQQQGDSGSAVAGLSGAQPRNSVAQKQQLLNQQSNGVQAHTAGGAGQATGGPAPRRLQPTPVDPQQQQQRDQASVLPGSAAVANGVEGSGRIPLQEQQQPHTLTPQHTPGKQQQQQSADNAVVHT